MRIRMMAFVGALAVSGIALVGCTSTPEPTVSPAPTATPTNQVTPTASRPTAEPSQTAEMVADQFVSDNIPLDGGSREFASGVVNVGDDGVPRSYVAAEGDVFDVIADRFGVSRSYLVLINAVRRDNVMVLYAGDTLNLGARTITTIGDQNGVVDDHIDRLPQPHPDQKG